MLWRLRQHRPVDASSVRSTRRNSYLYDRSVSNLRSKRYCLMRLPGRVVLVTIDAFATRGGNRRFTPSIAVITGLLAIQRNADSQLGRGEIKYLFFRSEHFTITKTPRVVPTKILCSLTFCHRYGALLLWLIWIHRLLIKYEKIL